jgi:hypothetical protein
MAVRQHRNGFNGILKKGKARNNVAKKSNILNWLSHVKQAVSVRPPGSELLEKSSIPILCRGQPPPFRGQRWKGKKTEKMVASYLFFRKILLCGEVLFFVSQVLPEFIN